MPEDKSGMQQAAEILQLVSTLSPVAIELVKALATKLQGKTDEELKASGDAIDDAIIAKAKEELGEQ